MDTQATTEASLSVLVVDDEKNIRQAVAAALAVDGHEAATAASAAEAVRLVGQRVFDLALVDLRLGTTLGLDLLEIMRDQAPSTRVIIMTAYATIDSAVEAMRRGATDYLPKPFTPAQLQMAVRRIAELRRLEREIQALRQAGSTGNGILESTDPAMSRTLALAKQVAASDATILLRGESGTGKSILAKAIHGWSRRAERPFAVVACPSLPEQLLEGELFGHSRGAFTGAVRDYQGRIAAAQGGTLFLDEIGALPLTLQPKLLRFAQDREYERLGEAATRRADVRLLAATNVDLDAAVAAGQFREDLLFRLNVIQIHIPPLRERPGDIPFLARGFLAAVSDEGRGPSAFTPEAEAALRTHPWPGNVRELRNAVERAAILCDSDRIGPQHLRLVPGTNGRLPEPSVKIGDPVTLEQVEELHIRRILAGAPSIEKAAEILGMDTVTLWRRRKKYGI